MFVFSSNIHSTCKHNSSINTSINSTVKIPKSGLHRPRYWREEKSCNHSAVPVMAAHYKYSNHDSSLTLPGCCASFHICKYWEQMTAHRTEGLSHTAPVINPKHGLFYHCIIHYDAACYCYTPYSCCCYTLVIPSPVRALSVLHPMLPCVPVTPYLQTFTCSHSCTDT